jgi:ferrous iron transport protein B
MVDKNSQIKSSLLISFISCSAKLPIYLTMVLALFSGFGVWVIFGMYLLGIVLAVIMAIVLEKTIFPTGQTDFIIEFPPLRFPKFFEIFNSVKSTCKQFLVKVFGVIFGASVLIWLLSNVNIKFEYVGETSKSILYSFSTIVAWLFKPIGLNNPNIICALLIGLVAKEMILSSFAISNKVKSVSMLAASLTVATNPICFNVASGISFLVFTLLYFPCISTFGVLLKQVGRKFAIMGCLMQLVVAYTTSYIVYNIATKGFVQLIVGLIVFLVCIVSIKILYQKAKNKKLFCNCINCNKCKK